MALQLITAATDAPLTLAEAKAHLRVDGTDEDTLISSILMAATAMAEQRTGRAYMTQTFELTLDAFPDAFELTRVPVQSVTSIIYADINGSDQTLSGSAYSLDSKDGYGFAYVLPTYNTNWPATREQANAVRLRYVAGYASAATVNPSTKAWILLMVGAMFENRQAASERQTFALGFADRLLDADCIY